jgi:O-succinylbenzoic acid--CoA ligase
VLDRRADLINSGGMNVYPSEVERVLLESGLAREVAVVGVAHPRWGQVPVAFVVPAVAEAERLLPSWAESRLAAYKRPVRIYLRTELPRNTNGKLLRRALAERALLD